MIDGQRGWDAWRPALWLLIAAAVMVGIDLGHRILATNDEARFAMLAQDMLHRGAWLFPQPNEIAVMAVGLAVMVGALEYGLRRDRLARAFLVACIGSAAWVIGWYHWELERRNAAYAYPRVRAEARRLLPESPVVATWGVYELPLSFYLGRRVVPIRTDGAFARMMSEHPQASAVLTEGALAQVPDRGRFQALPLDRLNFDQIVLVSRSPDAPRPDARP